jgi:Holliday junction resolvase RusA-like endonuclease
MRQTIFIPLKKIPSVTAQQGNRVTVRNGKPHHYKSPELLAARELFMGHLFLHRPLRPARGPGALIVKFCYPTSEKHYENQWKTTKPDGDNAAKLLKDCMTATGFWLDDAQVCVETYMRFYSLGSKRPF